MRAMKNPHVSNNDIVTEDSAALEFVAERGSTLRYCHSTGAWFCWNGNIWSRDEKYVAFHWAREMIRKLVQDESPRIRAISSKVSFCAAWRSSRSVTQQSR